MKHIKKINEHKFMGGIGIATLLVLSGCNNANKTDNQQTASQAIKNGAFVVIEEQADGNYKILEEYPSETTRVLLKEKNGTERMLSQEEIDKLLKEEETKIDNGTSELTNPSGSGLSLGGAILASAAGAIIGSWIGNKLFNNQNYQTQQRTSYKSPQAYERSKNSFNTAKNTTATKATSSGRSGFFGGGNNDNRNNAIGG
ncbi:UPF0323 family lipoprotein [Helicobacter sp. MIT 14-3879]|uniref:UPF0323 family lipoprotein n=1 Tax=Helicobacter sp. MIT 14-3879 TaxID=2040649 RepID=UPI000E1ED6A0|nr:UPF0323 family lipoprotein [Helicobacter sp. MIT 14-3879]RDU64107.1 hypothetical protein CQA44_04055 [Helicobacter sp. MIT 14-3879]